MNPNDRPTQLAPIRNRIDEILAYPIEEDLSFTMEPRTRNVQRTDRWTWVDALYMAPPAMGLLADATGDRRYLGFIDRELRATYDALFDPEEDLFYRDARSFNRRTPSGEKVFWSRGNGWAFAGLPLLLDTMPPYYSQRDFYVELFRRMATAVLKTQQPDGFWYPSLKDPAHVPTPEVSGTALFVFGLAWGVAEGVLDHETCWPAVERGWRTLETRVGPKGTVTFVQPVGVEPEPFPETSQAPYGHGLVLQRRRRNPAARLTRRRASIPAGCWPRRANWPTMRPTSRPRVLVQSPTPPAPPTAPITCARWSASPARCSRH